MTDVSPATVPAPTAGPPAPAPVLSYRNATDYAVAPAPSRWRLASLAALLPGVVVPFAPFACNRSPTEMLRESVAELVHPASTWTADTFTTGLLALPFFLAFPLFAWTFLRLVRRTPRALGAVFGVLGILGTLAFATLTGFFVVAGDGTLSEWTILAGAVTILLFGVAVVMLLYRKRVDPAARATAAMAGPYAANLFFCLVGFASARDLGWYLAVAPAAAALAELAVTGFVAFRSPGPPSRSAPT